MHKRVVVIVLALALLSGAAFASGPGGLSGIGIFGSFAGSTTGSTGGGVGLTLKFGSFPVLGIQYDLSGAGRLAVSCDYYVIDAQGLAGPLSFYLGVGAFGGLAFGSTMQADLGLRLPIGLQLWPVRKLEIFLAAVPLVRLIPTISAGIGGEVGLRVHF
jgi:hypothetical protein